MKKMRLDDIIIPDVFAANTPSNYKLEECRRNFERFNTQDRYIVVNRNNVLIDGYCAYLVLKEKGIEEAEIKISNIPKKRWKRKNIVSDDAYRNVPTMYVYGTHINGTTNKEYVWRVQNGSNWDWFKQNIVVGDIVLVDTNGEESQVQVTRIETLDRCPTNHPVKKIVATGIVRNGIMFRENR